MVELEASLAPAEAEVGAEAKAEQNIQPSSKKLREIKLYQNIYVLSITSLITEAQCWRGGQGERLYSWLESGLAKLLRKHSCIDNNKAS